MPLPQSQSVLEQLLTGHHMSADELDQLVVDRAKEDLYLEYKNGLELQKPNAADTIREYMSGFANSAGGVLIIGMNAPDGVPIEVTGCPGHKKGDLADWAARCITEMASFFSPLPRFHVVAHPKGEVLIGVTQRSLSLVPRRLGEGMVYHFRMHDQTLKAPDYLMGDLLLGRRQQPILQVSGHTLANLRRELSGASSSSRSSGAMDISIELRIHFENMSIVWAEECRWGIIARLQHVGVTGTRTSVSTPGRHLLSFVDVIDIPPSSDPRPAGLYHFRGVLPIDEPFATTSQGISFFVPIRFHQEWFTYTWKAALYVTAKNSLPLWHQINIVVNDDMLKVIDKAPSKPLRSEIIRLTTARPVVTWEPIAPLEI
jgi:hypothetical protein